MMFRGDENDDVKSPPLPEGYNPSAYDVCCGRGKKNWNHEGNTLFRRLIRNNVKAYQEAADKQEKTAVVISIVDSIRAQGGKFLKQDDSNRWYDIGDYQAREKVGHSLRDQLNAQTKALQQQGQETEESVESHARRRESPTNEMSPFKKQRVEMPLGGTRFPLDAANFAAGQRLVPSFINLQPLSLGLPLSLDQAKRAFGQNGTEYPLHNVASPLPGFPSNWSLALNRSPNEGRLSYPNFLQPLDASIEPTPLEEMFAADEQKKEDSVKKAEPFK